MVTNIYHRFPNPNLYCMSYLVTSSPNSKYIKFNIIEYKKQHIYIARLANIGENSKLDFHFSHPLYWSKDRNLKTQLHKLNAFCRA